MTQITKEDVLEFLNKEENHFVWFGMSKEELIKALEKISLFFEIVAEFEGEPKEAVSYAIQYGANNQLGKRYVCTKCSTEVLSTKAGGGRVECCGKPMKLMLPRPLPSSD